MKTTAQRFVKHLSASSPCWEWEGAVQSNGYSRFYDGERVMYGHQWAYQIFIGPLKEGFQNRPSMPE